jgi:hypothetical protein
LLSLAAITDDPELVVCAAGHDRTIINIKPEQVDAWLNRIRLTLPRCTGSLTTRGTRSMSTDWRRRENPERQRVVARYRAIAVAGILTVPDPGPQAAQPGGA